MFPGSGVLTQVSSLLSETFNFYVTLVQNAKFKKDFYKYNNKLNLQKIADLKKILHVCIYERCYE